MGRSESAGDRSLRRARLGGLAFSLMTVLACLLQRDTDLPLPRMLAALGAMALLAAEAVRLHRTRQAHWLPALASGPLLVTVGVGLHLGPAVVAVALGILASGSLYGSTRTAVLRAASVVLALPSMIVIAPLIDGPGDESTELVIVPTFVLPLFVLLLRVLLSALTHQQQAAAREALLSRTGQALLAAEDVAEARAAVRTGLLELAGMTDGPWVLLAQREEESAAVVAVAPGDAVPDGVRLPLDGLPVPGDVVRLTAVAGLCLDPLDRLPCDHVAGMPIGTTGEVVLVGHRHPLTVDVRQVVESMAVQFSLAERNHHAHDTMRTMAHVDTLTSIANRAAFFGTFAEAVTAHGQGGSRLAVLLVDLDDFKPANDQYGHTAGDAVLVTVARRMVEVAGEVAMVARFGGDEFTVLVTGLEQPAEVDALARRLCEAVRRPIPWADGSITVGASIGITGAPPGHDAQDLLRRADIAMYAAKSLGRNRVVRYEDLEYSDPDGLGSPARLSGGSTTRSTRRG